MGRLRLVVIFSAAVATMLKLQIAARTEGSNDVGIFGAFAEGVRDFGPVGVYGHHFEVSLYNHGPLVGWYLAAINWLLDHHVTSFPFLIRVPACLADFVTALLVFELVRLVRSPRDAAVAAVLVVWSPVLFVISGFHGNTDPVFVMFTLLSVYLLVVRGWALAAGVAFGIAVSIKLVPVVLAPLLVVVLVRLGWRRVGAFAGGGAIVFGLLWLPVVVSRWQAFRAQVLEYNGSAIRQWGLPQFLTWADLPGVAAWLADRPFRDPARERTDRRGRGLAEAGGVGAGRRALVRALPRPEPGLRHAVPGLGARRRLPDRYTSRDRLQPRCERASSSSSTTTGAVPVRGTGIRRGPSRSRRASLR